MQLAGKTALLAWAALGLGACTLLSSLDDLKGSPADAGSFDASSDAVTADAGDAAADAAQDTASCDADLDSDPSHCGACGSACGPGELCQAGACQPCDSSSVDCDGDGWLLAEGDCCDKPGACGQSPELVNPGAVELVGNGIDDNCNGMTDLFDTEDTVSCDTGLYSNSSIADNYARALGICRKTSESPPQPEDRTWGLIEAELLRADGSPLGDTKGRSIRTGFGKVSPKTTEGDSVVVLSTGVAADATQTLPGPNGGAPAGYNVSTAHEPASQVDIGSCALPGCISDWFGAANLPLKAAGELPTAPDCAPPPFGDPELANDSVMLRLRLRAPTNALSFSFNFYVISAEYPEFVCSSYNDQFIALVDTPAGTPSPIPNPPDKNLLSHNSAGQKWPIGINIAHGTSLFAVCESETANPGCWDSDVDSQSCQMGPGQLDGTGFEKSSVVDSCLIGGGTHWLTTAGNVIPGELVELRIVVWDVGDALYDSVALLDGFAWHENPVQPGTM